MEKVGLTTGAGNSGVSKALQGAIQERDSVICWQSASGGLSGKNVALKAYALFLLITVAAAGQSMPSLTVGEVTYGNVTVKKEYPSSFFIKHDGGTAFIERGALSEEQIAQLLGGGSEAVAAERHSAQPSTEQDYKQAKDLLKQDDNGTNWTQAVDLMRRAAEAGYPAAQYEWGRFLIDSFCVEQDVKKGEEFLRQAASAGEGRAIFELLKTENDDRKMRETLKKASDAGDSIMMIHHARLLMSGTAAEQAESRALVDKAFSSGDAMAMTTAAEMFGLWARDPKAMEVLGMTEQEMHAKAVEGLRVGCKERVLPAYPILAQRLADGVGMEKNEEESKKLLAEFKRLAGQRIARGSIGARLALMNGLRVSATASDQDETLRIATEILDESDYPFHHTVAALSGARAVEGKQADKAEGLRNALDWLKDRQKEIGGDSLRPFISNYEQRLANASGQ